MMKLSVVIVNYNVKAFLERALSSIVTALEGIPSEVFVVDNDSTDGSNQMVRERFPDVHLIANNENVGFAKANNQALRQARGEIVCLINPDTLVQEDTFRTCLDYLDENPKVGAVGCKILNSDGTLQLSCRRSFPGPWVSLTKMLGLSKLFPKSKLFGRYNLTYLDPDEPAEVEALSGSFMVVRKETVDQVGLLDEDFFMYGEDLDWCYRIGLAGWKIMYLPQTQIIHYKGQSAKKAPFDSLRVFFGAMHLFVQKHFKKGWSVVPQWLLTLGIGIWGTVSFLTKILSRWLAPLLDAGFLQLGLLIAIFIRFGNFDYWTRYHVVNVIYTLVWIGCLFILGNYRKGLTRTSKVLGGVAAGLILNTSITFFFPQYAFSRQVIITAGVLDAALLIGWRVAMALTSRVNRIPLLGRLGNKLTHRRALIVGSATAGKRILEKLTPHIEAGYDIVGFLGLAEQDLNLSMNGKMPVLGTLDDLDRIAPIHQVHEVIFSHEAVESGRILGVVAREEYRDINFKMMPRDEDLLIGRTSIDVLGDIPLVDFNYRIHSGPNRFLKRTMDLSAVFVSLPIWTLIWIGLRLNPAIRWHRKLISDGMGKSLGLLKPVHQSKKMSKRIAGIPLFWDILTGRMSLVGTEILPYNESLPVKGYKPGLTGLVQVNRHRDLSNEDRDAYSQYYLRNYSIFLDIEILWKAFFTSKHKMNNR